MSGLHSNWQLHDFALYSRYCFLFIYLIVLFGIGCGQLVILPKQCNIPYQADSVFYTSNSIWLIQMIGTLLSSVCVKDFYNDIINTRVYNVYSFISIVMLVVSLVIQPLVYSMEPCMKWFSIISIVEIYIPIGLISLTWIMTLICNYFSQNRQIVKLNHNAYEQI
jgi:hypothetical protein